MAAIRAQLIRHYGATFALEKAFVSD